MTWKRAAKITLDVACTILAIVALVVVFLIGLAVAYAGTITGTLQTPNGQPIKNGTINFTLTQAGLLSGTGAVVPVTSSCWTSIDGTIVGLPNPLAVPVAAVNSGSGTLPAGNYYIVLNFHDAASNQTLVSPELVINAPSGGSIIIQPPINWPTNAAGMNVYVSTTSGAETMQGFTVGQTPFTLSVPLVSGVAPPTSNAVPCNLTFNDQIIPYAGYNVSLISSSGKAYPGYPQSWQLNGGPSGTVNVSNGAPLWNGTVIYPMPILAQPLNHGPQSIAGPLNMTGYNLVNVGFLGVGTSVPGWGVDAEGSSSSGTINAQNGYLVNGSGGTASECLSSDGTAYNTPISCITSLTLFYQTVASVGSAETQRPTLNFSSDFTATDVPSPAETTIGLANNGAGAGSCTNCNETIDIKGRVVAYSNGPTIPLVQHSHNVTANTCPTGSSSFDSCQMTVSWPVSFTSGTSYDAACTGITPSDPRVSINGMVQTAGTIVVTVVTNGSVAVSYAGMSCVGAQ